MLIIEKKNPLNRINLTKLLLIFFFFSLKLTIVTNALKNIVKNGDIVIGVLNNLNNIMGIGQFLPNLLSYSKNMYQTTKLIITGAKVRKIKDSTNVNKVLNELDFET
tara:strand:+ start:2319 stop:2639 length:321 start_codon:yes stop_codon:yes gene_type:complete